jgi:hypothetical protein
MLKNWTQSLKWTHLGCTLSQMDLNLPWPCPQGRDYATNIGVEFGDWVLAPTWLKCVSDNCDAMCAYDGWACSVVEVHEFTCEVSCRSSKWSFFSFEVKQWTCLCLLLDHSWGMFHRSAWIHMRSKF